MQRNGTASPAGNPKLLNQTPTTGVARTSNVKRSVCPGTRNSHQPSASPEIKTFKFVPRGNHPMLLETCLSGFVMIAAPYSLAWRQYRLNSASDLNDDHLGVGHRFGLTWRYATFGVASLGLTPLRTRRGQNDRRWWNTVYGLLHEHFLVRPLH